MTEEQVGLFRYLCENADYNESSISTFKLPNGEYASYVEIKFEYSISWYMHDYSNYTNIPYEKLFNIVKHWIRSHILQLYRIEDNKKCYLFFISERTDPKYYDIIPLKVINRLQHKDDVEVKFSIPKYNYYKNLAIQPEEKKFFRHLMYKCDIKCSCVLPSPDEKIYNYWISLNKNLDDLLKEYSKKYNISKHQLRYYVKKWIRKGILTRSTIGAASTESNHISWSTLYYFEISSLSIYSTHIPNRIVNQLKMMKD